MAAEMINVLNKLAHPRAPGPFRLFAALVPLVLSLSCLPAVSAAPLVIRDTRWGFDGKAVPDTFNIFSVEIINPGLDAFEGVVRFNHDPFGSRNFIPYEEHCYLAPGASRWIQFCVLVEQHGNNWTLSWDGTAARSSGSVTVRHPDMGPPACVILAGDFGVLTGTKFRRFHESLMPVSPAAMAGLDAVLLDHAPRWQPPQRKAFLEWVRAGGTVHVLQDERGIHPTFADDLAVLNGAAARSRVGSGLVLRHLTTRQAVTPDYLANANAPPAALEQNQNVYMRLSETLARAYTPLLRTQHRWWVIYLIAMLYMAAIGLGVFLVARSVRNYRIAFFSLVGCIALATGCMQLAGYRSEREANAVYTMAYATPLGDGTFLARQWITAFAGRGGKYVFKHTATHSYYAPATTRDESAGLIRNGRDGSFTTDMPINSYRSFEYSGTLRGDDLGAPVAELSRRRGLASLLITVPPTFPSEVVSLWAVRRDRVVPLTRNRNVLSVAPGQQPSDLGDLLRGNVQSAAANTYYDPYARNQAHDSAKIPDEIAGRMQYILMAFALKDTDQTTHRISRQRTADDRITLFAMAKAPPGFRVSPDQFPRQHGYVMYCTEVEIREEK